jgi:histidinol dehydrogenase
MSGVSTDSFVKKITIQELTKDGLKRLASSVMTMARHEELEAHGNAVGIRLEGE